MILSNEKLIKVVKGALLAGGGAALVFLIETVPEIDMGQWAPMVAALLSIVLNILRQKRKELKGL